MYPRIVIDTKKLTHNVKIITDTCKAYHLSTMGVTKVFCADTRLAQCYVDGGVEYLADSRIENLKRLACFSLKKILLRLPSISEVNDVIRFADISLNSEIKTIQALNDAANKVKKIHNIILMIDLGDLREGILVKNFDETVQSILSLDHIHLHGIGVNLTCYGGVIPNHKNLGELVMLSKKLKEVYDISLDLVSGGNSSSLYLLSGGGMPEGINNLRLGEALVLGRETAYGEAIKGTYSDVFKLEAEIIEKKLKPSIPIGEIGMDAFGNIPKFEDQGNRERGILSIGRQDVNIDNLIPIDKNIKILGASSDHLIIDLTEVDKEYSVGDIVSFNLEYGALLSLMTSKYIHKDYR